MTIYKTLSALFIAVSLIAPAQAETTTTQESSEWIEKQTQCLEPVRFSDGTVMFVGCVGTHVVDKTNRREDTKTDGGTITHTTYEDREVEDHTKVVFSNAEIRRLLNEFHGRD
ncbi:MAG: hypothetical protein R3F02_04250 [Thiolinea sp.]